MKTPDATPSTAAQPADFQEPLRNAARAWERFWFSPADPTPLGLIRICCGLITLYVHIAYSFGLLQYLGPNGWIGEKTVQYVRYQQPIFAPGPGWSQQPEKFADGQYYWSIYFHLTDPAAIWAVHLTILVAILLFTVGFCTRVTTVLAWLGAMSYVQRAPTTLFGMDTMMMILLVYLKIGPSGAALSVDHWLKRRREQKRLGLDRLPALPPGPTVGANLALRLIQVHFCIIYLASGSSKLLGSSWWGGTAPNFVLLNYEFTPFNVRYYYWTLFFLSQHRWMWELMTSVGVIFTLVVEIGFPFLVWNRATRWLCVCGSVMLHTAIGLTMGLTSFSLMMLAMLLAFVPPEAVRQLLGGLGDLVGHLVRLVRPRSAPQEAMALTR
jgi:hypothetical protein